MKRIIGLTGGISTGKSTVSDYLNNFYKLPILDADIYAREAVKFGSDIWQQIVERYSNNILLPDGNLNRKELGNIIFSNPSERHWLESLIHPYVRDRFTEAITEKEGRGSIFPQQLSSSTQSISQNPVIVLAVPLLFEAKMTDLCTEIWVVRCSEQQQIERLIARDRLTLEQARARINSQMSIDEKCDRADVVIDNSSTIAALLSQVDLKVSRNEF